MQSPTKTCFYITALCFFASLTASDDELMFPMDDLPPYKTQRKPRSYSDTGVILKKEREPIKLTASVSASDDELMFSMELPLDFLGT